MNRKILARTTIIYAFAAVLSGVFIIAADSSRALVAMPLWLCVPLAFVFAYSRCLSMFASTAQVRAAASINGIASIAIMAVFLYVTTQFWQNPLDKVPEQLGLVVFFAKITTIVIFATATLFLLIRHRSSLATLASVLFWPYWFVVFLLNVDERMWPNHSFATAAIMLLFALSPVLLAFGAGAVSSRRRIAHVAVLAAVFGVPWLYYKLEWNSVLENAWIAFNLPQGERVSEQLLFEQVRRYNGLAIVAVGVSVLAFGIAFCRVLPKQWEVREKLVAERTWPGAVAAFSVLAVWFGQSVLPYRIPGAVDRWNRPTLQILRVEKHGLHFHETLVDLRFRGYPGTTVTRTDRRWFEYTFSPRSASGVLAEPLFKRAHVFADSWRGEWNPVSPIWRWNADVWYVDVEGKGLKVFPNARESAPPQEVIAIFQEAEQVSNTPTQRSASVSDVCLGFCYDGLSAMGYTFVNERCGNDGSGYVCR